MKKMARILLLLLAPVLPLTGCGGGSENGGATLSSVEVTPVRPSLARGTSIPVKATAVYSDRRTEDVTAAAVWSSSDPGTAAVSGASGLVTGTGSGSAEITASFGGKSGRQEVAVTDARLESVEVAGGAVASRGMTQQFSATARFDDGTVQDVTGQVVWKSSAPGVASIGPGGVASYLASGEVRITAEMSAASVSASGSAQVRVEDRTVETIQVLPIKTKVAEGTRLQLTAVAIFNDGASQVVTAAVTWLSSDDGKAEVSNAPGAKGLVIAKSAGTVTVKAIFFIPGTAGRVEGSADIEVTSPEVVELQVRPATPAAGKDTVVGFTAFAVFSDRTVQDVTNLATWYSEDESKVQVSNAPGSKGTAKGIAAGNAAVVAWFRETQGTTSMTVLDDEVERVEVTIANTSAPFTSPPPVTLEGATVQFRAVAVWKNSKKVQDITGSALWDTGDESVARVSNAAGAKGSLQALSSGSTPVRAAFKGVAGSATLTVKPTSSVVKLEVTPVNPKIAEETTQGLRATAIFSDDTLADVTAAVTWRSSDDSVAVVSNAPASKGSATARPVSATTTATVYASYGDREGSTVLTVADISDIRMIEVSPQAPLLKEGTVQQFTAMLVFNDGFSQNVSAGATWESSDQTKLQASNAPGFRGFAVAVSAGVVKVKASILGFTGETDVTVTSDGIVELEVKPAPPTQTTFLKDTEVQFTATGLFAGRTRSQLLTNDVAWYSSEPSVAYVSNTRGSKGRVFALSAGQATITAAYGTLQASFTITIVDWAATRLAVSANAPFPPFLVDFTRDLSVPFTATIFFRQDDASPELTQTVTELCVWKSSDDSVAEAGNALGSRGVVTGKSTGTASVTATFAGLSVSPYGR